jgi:hypothetical protein
MPILKPISGHTSCSGVFRYLTKDGRALASDYINLDVPERDGDAPFDWARIMDDTRHRHGNDRAWGGKPARTYKHYVLSPDPEDGIDLDGLRSLAVSWAQEHFGDYEVAIVYHDDNASRIPHAHVVVNNTNLATGNRLQDPDPKALKHSLQAMAKGRGLHDLDTDLPGLDSRRDRFRNPPTLQAVYRRRAEAAIEAEGGYSWVADIRRRVGIARAVARNEAEFRSVLNSVGIEVADNSPNTARRDWVYSMAEHPTWRITGEKLGVSYGKEAISRKFESQPFGRLSDASERRIAEIARTAFELGDLGELRMLSEAVEYVGRNRIRSVPQLEESGAPEEVSEFIRSSGILPQRPGRKIIPEPDGYDRERTGGGSNGNAARRNADRSQRREKER